MSEVKVTQKTDFTEDKRYLGHPLALGTGSFMALASAFGNYGMASILIYYLYKTVDSGGLGFTEANAAQFISVFNSLVFVAGIVGGYIADRVIGVRKALYIGFSIKTVGYLLLAIPNGGTTLYLASQLMLLFAAASMGTSLYALVGKLYNKTDTRRDAGFSIMYIMNNVGAIAPVITGTIAVTLNYSAGFLLAAVVQGLGIVLYALTSKKLFGDAGVEPDDPLPQGEGKKLIFKMLGAVSVALAIIGFLLYKGILTPTSFSNIISTVSIFIPIVYLTIILKSKKTTKEEAKRVWPFIWIFLCNCFNMMIWYQSTSIMAIYADTRVDRVIFGMEITPAAFQTIPAIFAVSFGTLASIMWTKMKSKQPSTPLKFGIGTVFWGLGPLLMVIPFMLFAPGIKVNPIWLIVFYALIMWGEALTAPVGMASATVVAPKAFTAQMVTVWQLTQSTGSGLSALAVNFYKEGSEAQYFLGIGLVTCLVGGSLWLFSKKMSKIMGA